MVKLGYVRASASVRAPRITSFSPISVDRALDMYRRLGGRLDHPTLAPGSWDLTFGDLLVELDEELHFNRYRALTLEPEWTASLPWRNSYHLYAVEFESRCLGAGKWGARWTSQSSARLLGAPDAPGVFGAAGSPRWKQRALYDSLKDLAAYAGQVRLARLSIYDMIGEARLGAVLKESAVADLAALRELIEARTHA